MEKVNQIEIQKIKQGISDHKKNQEFNVPALGLIDVQQIEGKKQAGGRQRKNDLASSLLTGKAPVNAEQGEQDSGCPENDLFRQIPSPESRKKPGRKNMDAKEKKPAAAQLPSQIKQHRHKHRKKHAHIPRPLPYHIQKQHRLQCRNQYII